MSSQGEASGEGSPPHPFSSPIPRCCLHFPSPGIGLMDKQKRWPCFKSSRRCGSRGHLAGHQAVLRCCSAMQCDARGEVRGWEEEQRGVGCMWRSLHSSLDLHGSGELLYRCMPRWGVTLLSTHSPTCPTRSCCAIVAAGAGAAPQRHPRGGFLHPLPWEWQWPCISFSIYFYKEGGRDGVTS